MPAPFNPTTLRKAKIVCNFGLSECYRVNHRGNIFTTFGIYDAKSGDHVKVDRVKCLDSIY